MRMAMNWLLPEKYEKVNEKIKIAAFYRQYHYLRIRGGISLKRKVKHDAAKTNNKTPVESMPKVEFDDEFTDMKAFKTAENARISNRIEDEGKR